jgi:hypothetical protein
MQLWQSLILDVIFCTCIVSNRISPYPCIIDSLCFTSKRIALHILIFWQSHSYANTMFECNNFKGLSSTVSSMNLIRLRNFLSNRGTFVLDKLFFCCFYSITTNIFRLNVLSVMGGGGSGGSHCQRKEIHYSRTDNTY